jgi:hypothetical protein
VTFRFTLPCSRFTPADNASSQHPGTRAGGPAECLLSRRVRSFASENLMLLQVIKGTPLWVWALLAALLWLGFRQTQTRVIGSRRAVLVPGIFVILSLAGVVTAFQGNALAIAVWGAGVGVAVGVGQRLMPRLRATWRAAGDTLQIAGSWLPLALIVSLFFVKFAAGVSMAIHPGLASETDFVIACSLAYGFFSGLFAARALQLWQVRSAARA